MSEVNEVSTPQFDTIAIQQEGFELRSSENTEVRAGLSFEPSATFVMQCLLAATDTFKSIEIWSSDEYQNLTGRGRESNQYKIDFRTIRHTLDVLQTPLIEKVKRDVFVRSDNLAIVDERT